MIRRTANVMREREIRKLITIPKRVFHISDSDGNSKDFVVRQTDKGYLYTVDDVAAVVDTVVEVINESIRKGEPVTIRGFGTFGLKYMKPKLVTNVRTGEKVMAEGQFLPKFSFGHDLKMSATAYTLTLKDKHLDASLPIYSAEYEMSGD